MGTNELILRTASGIQQVLMRAAYRLGCALSSTGRLDSSGTSWENPSSAPSTQQALTVFALVGSPHPGRQQLSHSQLLLCLF